MKRQLNKSVRKAKRSFKKLRTRDAAGAPGNGSHGGVRRGFKRGLNIEGIPSKHLEGD